MRFEEGNEYGKRNYSELRYKLYRKQKNLFTCVDNRLKRRMKHEDRGRYRLLYSCKQLNRFLKLLLVNMDRDRWVRDVFGVYSYSAKQPGKRKAYCMFDLNYVKYVNRLMRAGVIEAKKNLETISKENLAWDGKRRAVRISQGFLDWLDLPEKYFYTGSLFLYDTARLDDHMKYNEFVRQKQIEEETKNQ